MRHELRAVGENYRDDDYAPRMNWQVTMPGDPEPRGENACRGIVNLTDPERLFAAPLG